MPEITSAGTAARAGKWPLGWCEKAGADGRTRDGPDADSESAM